MNPLLSGGTNRRHRSPARGRRAVLAIAAVALAAPAMARADTGKDEAPAPSVAPSVMTSQALALRQAESLDGLSAAVAAHPDTYGGVSTAGETVGVIHVAGAGTPSDPDVDAAWSSADLNDVAVSVDHVKYSLGQLQSVADRIPTAAPFAALGDGLVRWGVNPDTNSVEVGVTSVTPDLTAQAQAAFGDEVTLTTAQPVTATANRFEDTVRYYGGDWTTGAVHPGCSLGFDVVDFRGNQLMLTAGHCYSLYEHVYQFQSDMGHITSRSYGDNLLDAEFIWNGSTTPNIAPRIWVGPPSWSTATSYPVHGAANSCKGCHVYADGSQTGQSLGTLINYPVCARISGVVSCGIQEIMPANGQRLCQPGDSGGPVFAYDGKGGVTAIGILTGGSSDGDCLYTRFPDIAVKFNVRIATG